MLEYDRLDAKVVCTSSTMSTEAVINATDIEAGHPIEWLALLVSREKRICSSFYDCMISFCLQE